MKPYMLVLLSLVLVLALLGSSQVQTMAGQLPSMPQISQPESFVFTLEVSPLQITQDEAGFAQPQLEGYEASASPGDPLLPGRTYQIALPPDVIPGSVKANVIRVTIAEQAGVYTLAPAPPGVIWEEEQEVVLWGKNADSIVDGQNTLVYQNDAYFPQSQLSAVRFDQMRKWRFVSLFVTPLQYNPVNGKLRLATQMQIQVSFERAASVDQRQRQIELSDTVMDDRAAEMFYNYAQARAWYPLMERPEGLTDTYDYVIVTSNAILADDTASAAINSFVAHKQGQGYSVLVVTENQYGVHLSSIRAQQIRQWLHDNYLALSIHYVLLIGDPTPFDPDFPFDLSGTAVGDVPMRKCWPMRRLPDQKGYRGQNIPTDMLYANLEGNWDLNSQGQGDPYCGELTDDEGTYGMSFQPNVYVGRIPVYRDVSDWAKTLDSILGKTIIYEDSGNLDWRKRALLPMSFFDDNTDGAYLAEAMKSDYLNAAGYSSYTLYQQDGCGCNSPFASNQGLVDTAVRDHWKDHDYGLVTWVGHGGWDRVAIGNDDCGWSGDILSSGDANLLDDNHPAIVFSASCNNGFPEVHNNLGYALLKRGAVATLTSSRVSGKYWGFELNESLPGSLQLGYYIMQRIVSGQAAGHALYDEKWEMSQIAEWNDVSVVNWLDYNLYGDPSLRIDDGHLGTPNAPSNLTATSTPNKGIYLTWTDNSDNETGFAIERTINPSIAWMSVGTAGINATSWSDSGLTCGIRYYYRVNAYNKSQSAWSNQADAWSALVDGYETDNTYLDAKPISTSGYYSVDGQTHNFHIAGDVDWVKFHAVGNKTYHIKTYYLSANNDTSLELYFIDGVTLLASNNNCTSGDPASCITNWVAPSNGDYYIKVSNAQDEGGCSGYEYGLAVGEENVTNWPAQPTNLTATPVSHCQVNLAWNDNSTNEIGFEIERWVWKSFGAYGMMTWQKIATVGLNVTSYSDAGLDCNTTYPYRVRAYNWYGESFYSNTSEAMTFTADTFEADNTYAAASTIVPNGTPQWHNFHAAGDVDWSKFSAIAGRTYTITTSYLGSANDTFLALYNKNGTSALEWNDDCDNRLESCINQWTAPSSGVYYVRVRNYYDEGGCPGYQYTLKVTVSPLSTLLNQPSGLWIHSASVLSVQLAWPDTISSETHTYQVERRVWITPTLGLWRQIGIAGPGIEFLARPSGGNTGFIDTNLACNTVYDYRIRASDAPDVSAYSEVISATTSLWDSYEPDDDYTQAHTLAVNGPAHDHNLGPAMDYDWISLTVTAGQVYTITTSQFTHGDNDLLTLALYNHPPTTPLTSTQQCGADQRTLCLNGWSAPTSGVYYIRVSGQGGCPGHDYTLTVLDSSASASRPAAPTGFTGTLTAPDQIDLSWSDNSLNETGFRMDLQFGLAWLQVANLAHNLTSYRVTGLSCGQPYSYRVYAYNASGKSDYAMFTISTPGCGYPVIYLPIFMIP